MTKKKKGSHNCETVFDPPQNERLDINPGCFMKMPFICPSNMMILFELTEKAVKSHMYGTISSLNWQVD